MQYHLYIYENILFNEGFFSAGVWTRNQDLLVATPRLYPLRHSVRLQSSLQRTATRFGTAARQHDGTAAKNDDSTKNTTNMHYMPRKIVQ